MHFLLTVFVHSVCDASVITLVFVVCTWDMFNVGTDHRGSDAVDSIIKECVS